MPKPEARGKHTNRHIDDSQEEHVKAHISSFAVVESRYYCATTNRQRLEPKLSVSRLYDVYRPVKESYYRCIFKRDKLSRL